MANLRKLHKVDFAQMVIYNKGGISTAKFLDKQLNKARKHVYLPTTGWDIRYKGTWYALGSVRHWHCTYSTYPIMAVATDNFGIKLPPSASKGKPANKLEYFNPKLPPKFYILTFRLISSLSFGSFRPSPHCTAGIISFLAAQHYCSLHHLSASSLA